MDSVQPAFETQRFNPFNLNNNLLVNNLHDPDIIYLVKQFSKFRYSLSRY